MDAATGSGLENSDFFMQLFALVANSWACFVFVAIASAERCGFLDFMGVGRFDAALLAELVGGRDCGLELELAPFAADFFFGFEESADPKSASRLLDAFLM